MIGLVKKLVSGLRRDIGYLPNIVGFRADPETGVLTTYLASEVGLEVRLGATVTCLDDGYAASDLVCAKLAKDFLAISDSRMKRVEDESSSQRREGWHLIEDFLYLMDEMDGLHPDGKVLVFWNLCSLVFSLHQGRLFIAASSVNDDVAKVAVPSVIQYKEDREVFLREVGALKRKLVELGCLV